ncbi:MAG: DUF2490 domain-containing protein [Dysgonamonadaceae bacterium]|jgi:hypothetical protein|nr:DUF2490 domain-containing protein [Dysgonamonadaceae bacterium]
MLRGFDLPPVLLFLLLSLPSFAQTPRETTFGASLSVEAEKELSRFFSLTGEEEVRLRDNSTGFDRSVTSLGIDYAFFDRKAKIGIYYAFLYLYNNDHLFEPRHRYYLNFSYKETVEPFILSWRGRLQGTYRDENRGEYKINPKYVMKNKLEAAYMIWGSPWKPYLSCDISTSLNDPVRGNELTRLRFQGGASWRLNRTTYLDFFLRCDEYLVGDDPRVLSVGASYKMKF